jgi:hypothetical protein
MRRDVLEARTAIVANILFVFYRWKKKDEPTLQIL